MSELEIAGLRMQVNRKNIKNLHISVLPPDGRIRLSVPQHMTDVALRMAVASRIPWIRKQQKDFANQPRQSDRQMVSGESHYLWGQNYRLDVIEKRAKHHIALGGKHMRLTVSPATTLDNRVLVLTEFYRAQLKERIENLLPKWTARMDLGDVSWGVKKMKTRWGSCNAKSRRIWINLEMAKKPPVCLEYILVHELVHLRERHHNDRFRDHMNRLLPDWKERRQQLNATPLGYENWHY
ncbi:M48 family metallopeptidase [Parathalassolituus penaei]|uniref:SprT family zinc-dependent metalloprotease n=1 Tax=Parathalassolituus penaei TaxID=2997323 RepID=A0A9X3EBK3_9GAMM|nr:SprT family zinc-dependent metalloprotease [Parathalassolituus penaei]MCY0964544.1 SprT family zinc-dependent metalloprotease [Parathalassolituus penaei]